jgi:hypothetical protein
MLKRIIQASVVVGALSSAAAAVAAPFFPANGPTSIAFTNREQICASCILSGDTMSELNWGIAAVNTVRFGDITEPGATIEANLALFPQFTAGATAQITAIFYGLKLDSFSGGVLESTGGFLDVYYDEPGLGTGGTIVNINTLLPGGRTSASTYTGITDGVLLAHLEFAAAVDPTEVAVTISGSAAGLPGTITGIGSAEGYGNVLLGFGGLWESLLNTDFFTDAPAGGGPLAFGSRDFRFRNTFSALGTWSGLCQGPAGTIAGSTCLGAQSSDPITFNAPEPGVLGLLGLALLGLAGFRRRVQA